MGKRGPSPKPTPLRILHGDQPNRINFNEPKPPPADPTDHPEHLSEEAREVWDRLAPALARKGIFTEWDRDCFFVFCEAVVAHRKAVKLVGQSLLVKGLHGGLVKNPAHQLVRDNAMIIRGFAQEFGLTPSARSGISIPQDEETGELARLLS